MDFEGLGVFYLGREFDPHQGKLLERPLLYDARDLTTHAVCVGMTGSGKTGLCINLLEEAALDQVPALIIDPKGDMTNLLLTFPELRGEDFLPWVNPDEARRKNLSIEKFAAQQAALWRRGLGEWGQSPERIARLREAADFVVYTPGSEAGLPVSILQSLAAPTLDWDSQGELLRERIQGLVTALLGLIGREADPVQSREHILLANLIEHFWRQGQDLDFAQLILAIQRPPLRRLGVLEVDTFFPEEERFRLALRLNHILASPAFQSWTRGSPLEIAAFLRSPDGRPRHSIFYIAHLDDAQRMFFLTMLLNQLRTWIQTQPGTTSLRALLYMDEIFGFFPPVANPPSKKPMLSLLKQARAFGVGIVLSTQNPVDLDYKGLTNAGTWFIGRLQAERDKMRLLEGLQGAAGDSGFRPEGMNQLLSALQKRVFLLHNVHQPEPVVFQTRWAMSYLRGPLTRQQVRLLMEGRTPPQSQPSASLLPLPDPSSRLSPHLPLLSPAVKQLLLPLEKDQETACQELEARLGGEELRVKEALVVYHPFLLGIGKVHFADTRRNVEEVRPFQLLLPLAGRGLKSGWEEAWSWGGRADRFPDHPYAGAHFLPLPDELDIETVLGRLQAELEEHLYRRSRLPLLHHPALGLDSRPGEGEEEFRLRLAQQVRERRDREVQALKRRHEKRLGALQDKLERARLTVARRQATADSRKKEAVLSLGESLLGFFLGRRSLRSASTSMSKYRMSKTAQMSAREAEENLQTLEREIRELEEELHREREKIAQQWDASLQQLELVEVKPRRRDVQVRLFALAWGPFWRFSYQDRFGNTHTGLVEAFPVEREDRPAG